MGFYGPQSGRSLSSWTSKRLQVECVGQLEEKPEHLRMTGCTARRLQDLCSQTV